MARPAGSASHAITSSPRGRPVGWRKPEPQSVVERISAALGRHRVDLDDADAVASLLRLAGFRLTDIARHVDEAVARVKPRP